nr:MAG TPA: hypothetical protein [Caudoviricetes sp.]
MLDTVRDYRAIPMLPTHVYNFLVSYISHHKLDTPQKFLLIPIA